MGDAVKRYQVIYADPPWRYDFSKDKTRAIENHYPTMSVEEIKALDVPSDSNAVLYLWATAPKLQEGLDVVKAWGFQYRTHAIWDKETVGMGYWFRGQHELLLVGVKGIVSPPIPTQRIASVIRQSKAAHSRKPDYVREMIGAWFPTASKLEMFARRNETNLFQQEIEWDVWGNQVKSDLTLV
jgi:N6-adenosine-specific RNA methylase IME4